MQIIYRTPKKPTALERAVIQETLKAYAEMFKNCAETQITARDDRSFVLSINPTSEIDFSGISEAIKGYPLSKYIGENIYNKQTDTIMLTPNRQAIDAISPIYTTTIIFTSAATNCDVVDVAAFQHALKHIKGRLQISEMEIIEDDENGLTICFKRNNKFKLTDLEGIFNEIGPIGGIKPIVSPAFHSSEKVIYTGADSSGTTKPLEFEVYTHIQVPIPSVVGEKATLSL
jgi:hypothetical protein